MQEKEVLESVIPSNIVIGPFWVNTENVRQALSKKRKALSNAVLELLAKKLRQQADGVSLLYFTSAGITMATPDNVFDVKTSFENCMEDYLKQCRQKLQTVEFRRIKCVLHSFRHVNTSRLSAASFTINQTA